MRYAFNNESMSIINRVYNAMLGHTGYVGAYVSFDIRLAGILWFEADRLCDWGGETDNVYDTYPSIKIAYDSMMKLHLDHGEPMDDNVGDAEILATEFENKLYLAMVVVNAYKALEGAPFQASDSVWSDEGLKAINAEFHNDRKKIQERVDNILSMSKAS